MLDDELRDAPTAYFNRRLMKMRVKVANELSHRGVIAKDVQLMLEKRKISFLREVEFKKGTAEFVDGRVAHSVLDQLATTLITCNQLLAKQDMEPTGPISLSLGVSGPEPNLANNRANICKEILVKKLQSAALGGDSEISDSLIRVAGQTNPSSDRAVLEVGCVVPGDMGQASVPATEGGKGPEVFNDLTRDHCLLGHSTDYDPFHTWLPHELRKTNPWPVSGPKKPEP
jgi:hypothetical protein